MRRFEYAVLLAPAEEGGFVVTCRDLPEVTTQGENVEGVLAQAVDAMDEAFAAWMKSNEDFPKPTRPREGEYLVSPPAETILKAALRVKPQRAAGPLGCADKNLP
jgi:antitoxin HicB